MSNDPNFLAVKALLNTLPDALAEKICKQKLAGIETKKKSRAQRVKENVKYLQTKMIKL